MGNCVLLLKLFYGVDISYCVTHDLYYRKIICLPKNSSFEILVKYAMEKMLLLDLAFSFLNL